MSDKEKQAELINVLHQDLGDYWLEINSCAMLNKLSEHDLYEVKNKVERFLGAMNKVLEEE